MSTAHATSPNPLLSNNQRHPILKNAALCGVFIAVRNYCFNQPRQAVGGIGVTGESNTGTGSGVYGIGKFGGTGVYGISSSGYAVYANGNAGQTRDKSGFVKAMLYVDPFQPSFAYIQRCYNGITNNSNGDCGFSVVRDFTGWYSIDFGFQVNDRFYSLTLEFDGIVGAVSRPGTNQLQVRLYQSDDPSNRLDSPFWLIIY